MKFNKTIWTLVAMVSVLFSCKEKYNPGIEYPNTGYLVVEGFINSGQGTTSIKLSRTVKISDAVSIKYEQNAAVRVEGDDNSSYTLSAQGNGLYTVGQLPLKDARKYRLYIRTSTGTEYRSEYVNIVRTPPIDSVSWTRETSGVQIHINTHDPTNKTGYYTWNYEETWEFRATYQPNIKYLKDQFGNINAVGYIFPSQMADTAGYRCWQYQNSTSILIGSSKKLSEDVIHLPLLPIEEGSWKLSQLYSVKVYQHGLSERGYEFLQRMKKNTQQVGSIFDGQPSELNSNIHNIANATEVVIGFIDVADAQEKRIFIDAADVRNWPYRLQCEILDIPNIPDSVSAYSFLACVYPTETFGQTGIRRYLAATNICVDCRLRGSNVRPSYWPR